MRTLAITVCLASLSTQAWAQPAKTLRFWNLTAETITELYVAPAGTTAWWPNLCLSDPDHTVEADERLNLGGTKPGQYDVRFVDTTKRMCLLKNVTLKADGAYAFSLSESEMKACAK